ncbi:MAG TPA: HAMP domain-containing sensor histidine kinase [Actinomycetes bacterium]|nr:HAMP domain-containing sensor histidine kinase [Actinomycetes bacterium]
MRRAAEPVLAPAAGALLVGFHVLALEHAWRRVLVPIIGPLEAPPVTSSPARPSARSRSSRASGPTTSSNGQGGQNVTFAHELRRRLAALRVLSEAIEVRNGSDDTDRLVHLLVRELHDLEELEAAMLGAGRRDTREEVDVGEVAKAAAQTVGLARRSDITVQGSRRPLLVLANPTMLRQALENLMDNAATCGAGHPVEVIVRLAMTHRLPGVEVLVADRGPGLGKASNRRRSGQGVGLPLVRKFAHESSGRLWCGDRDGGGAVFGLWLPIDELRLPRLAGGTEALGHSGNGHTRDGNGHGPNGNGLRRA